jgi:PAT family beta-lactamase induction signal transducer AmpG
MALSLDRVHHQGPGFTADVGTVSKGFGLGATILGAFIGGLAVAQIGLYRSLLWLGIAQAITILPYARLRSSDTSTRADRGDRHPEPRRRDGHGSLRRVAHGTLQRASAPFSTLLSALASLGRIFLGPVSGGLATSIGWPQFFVTAFCVAPRHPARPHTKRELEALDPRSTCA